MLESGCPLMSGDVTVEAHSSAILVGNRIAFYRNVVQFDQIFYAAHMTDSDKKHSKKKYIYIYNVYLTVLATW